MQKIKDKKIDDKNKQIELEKKKQQLKDVLMKNILKNGIKSHTIEELSQPLKHEEHVEEKDNKSRRTVDYE